MRFERPTRSSNELRGCVMREVEELMVEAVQAFGPSVEERTAILGEIESAAPRTRTRKGVWATAAGLIASAATWLIVILVPTEISLAEIQQAFEGRPWVRVEFDDGSVVWHGLRDKVYATKSSQDVYVFADLGTGLNSSLVPFESTILERRDPPRPADKTAWDAVVGSAEELAESPDHGRGRWSAKATEERINGETLLRFDWFRADAFDRKHLTQQLWADPETRLPVRTRELLDAGVVEGKPAHWKEGRLFFPQDGPKSIYDLGVSRDVKIERESEPNPKPEVRTVLDAILNARQAFPTHFRSVSWHSRDDHVEILTWSGKQTIQVLEDGTRLPDDSSCRVRFSRYNLRKLDKGARKSFAQGVTGPELLTLFAGTDPVRETLYERGRRAAWRDDGWWRRDPASGLPSDLVLEVSLPGSQVSMSYSYFPRDLFWGNVLGRWDGNWELLEDAEGAPLGTIGLRVTRGGRRVDAFFDPQKDYLCVQRIQSTQTAEGWALEFAWDLGDLVQLPGGQWVAQQVVSSAGELEPQAHRLYIEAIDEADIDDSQFDTNRIIEEARGRGWEVR